MTLFSLTSKSIADQILAKQLDNKILDSLPLAARASVIYDLEKIELPIWKKNIVGQISSDEFMLKVLKLESKHWCGIQIMWNKYYDEWGMRDWYQDICIEFGNGEETIIEEHNDEHYNLYKKIAEDMAPSPFAYHQLL